MNKREFWISTQLGLQFALTLCIFTWAGYWLDGKFGSSPVFIITSGFIGFAAGMYYVVAAAKAKVNKNGSGNSGAPHNRPPASR